MASIERRRGLTRIRWRPGGRGTKEKFTKFQALTAAQAQALKTRVEAGIAAVRPLSEYAALTMEEVLARWRRSKLEGDEPNDDWTTDNSISRARKHFAAMGWDSAGDITPSEVERWRTSTANTRRVGVIIAGMLRYARDFLGQPVDHMTLAALRPPRGKWRRKKRELPETKAVLGAFRKAKAWGPGVAALVHTAAIYGWRAATLAKLDIADIERDVAHTKVKGARIVDVALMKATRAALKEAAKGRKSGAVFLDPRTGKRWDLHGSGSIWQFCRDHLGLPYYDLKYFAATNILDVMKATKGQTVTGHLTPGQLESYGRTNAARSREAIGELWKSMSRTVSHRAKRGRTRKRPHPQKALIYGQVGTR